MDRELKNTESALLDLAGEAQVRPVSLFTLAACQMLDNRIGLDIFEGREPALDDAMQVTEFLWLHAAEKSAVMYLVARARQSPAAVHEAVLIWSSSISAEKYLSLRSEILGSGEAVAAADARAILDDDANEGK